MRTRALHIGLLTALLAAGSEIWLRATPTRDPPRAAGDWTLSGVPDCGKHLPSDRRQWRGISGARRICRARYQGPVPIQLTLVELPGTPGATAFDAWQKWPPSQPGKIGFYKGRFFGVVESAADRETLLRFTNALEEGLPGRGEGRW